MKPDPVIARHLKDLLEKLGFLRSRHGISAVELRDVIIPALGQALARMAGFRNLLIHEYAIIKEARMRDYLRHNLDDFDQFAAAVRAYLRRR